MPSYTSVGVIGAGAWGTALAGVAARAGRDVVLYARSAESAAQMKSSRTNPRLPGMRLDERIDITGDIAAAAARRHHPDRNTRAEPARGRVGAGAASFKKQRPSLPAPRASSAARINS